MKYVISEVLNFLESSMDKLIKSDIRLASPRAIFRDLKKEILAI
jgi:hypothetical protein